MNEQLAFLALVVSRLEAAGVKYMVTGSVALAVYATPRMTRDIDVVIDCDEDLAARLAASFQSDSYASTETAREAARTHGMFNVIHNESLLKADFIVHKPDPYTTQRFTRRKRISLGQFSADFVAPEDLILAKLRWSVDTGSERQIDDVRALISGVPDLNWKYLATWAAQQGVREQLERVKSA